MKNIPGIIVGFLATIAAGHPARSFDFEIRMSVEDFVQDYLSSKSNHQPKPAETNLPIVNLGYEKHQALPDEEGRTYYKFANIPYAKPPTGSRRFKAAEPFTFDDFVKNPPLNEGKQDVVCPQEQVGWFPLAQEFSGVLFDPREGIVPLKWLKKKTVGDYGPIPQPNKLQNESCLVLDVYVPKRVWDDRGDAGVVVLFHGGGFVFGSKNIFGSPEGMLNQSAQFGDESDIIFISVNYRLGAFGWLAGNDFQDAGGLENAGLTDQLVALEWVDRYKEAFAGYGPVTVLGESAGASSIMHLITAYGGPKIYNDPARPKFDRAIMQSPAFFPNVDREAMGKVYAEFLAAAGVNNFAELQAAPTEDLLYANSKTIFESPYGRFNYGPVVSSRDDKFVEGMIVPEPTQQLLAIGRSWMRWLDVIMVANNRREGAVFTPPWIRANFQLRAFMKDLYPRMEEEAINDAMKLYPINELEPNQRLRILQAAAVFGDLGVDCNVWSLRKSHEDSRVWQYYYRLYPGFHGQDVGATFWNFSGPDLAALNNEDQSQRLQRYITSFVKWGNPNKDKLKEDDNFDNRAAREAKVMYIGSGVPVLKEGEIDKDYGMKEKDPLPSDKICEFWEKAPYWPPEKEDNAIRHRFRAETGYQEEL